MSAEPAELSTTPTDDSNLESQLLSRPFANSSLSSSNRPLSEHMSEHVGEHARHAKTPLSSSSSGSGSTSERVFAISLDFFSGPMDLLLHLVHQQEVKIEEVSMRLVAEQYLHIVSNSRLLDLEKASEYLVIAATLMSIKSASLLPATAADGEGVPEELGENFYEELRARLKAYELTKSRAQALVALPQLGVDVFLRNDRKALLPTPEMLAEPEEVNSLAMMFGRLLKRIGGTANAYRIRLESISVVSYMMKVVDMLGAVRGTAGVPTGSSDAAAPLSFRSLLKNFADARRKAGVKAESSDDRSSGSRGVVIGSFIAVLELVKRGLVRANQPGDDSEIRLELQLAQYGAEVTMDDVPFESEFDTPHPASDSSDEPADAKVVSIADYKRKERPTEPLRKEANSSGDY